MRRVRRGLGGVLGAGTIGLTVAVLHPSAAGQGRPDPRPEPVAETRLLMEGLAGANLRGLAGLLRDRPPTAEAWAFARGQALLIAETGNLLLLRPPRSPAGRPAWAERAADLRAAAVTLARAAAEQDYGRSRAALAALANACNRCHQTFGVGFRADPFPAE